MQFKTAQELNKIIDDHLPNVRPPFCRHEVTIGGEGFEVYYRDVIECVKALLGDARLDPHLIFVPEFHEVERVSITIGRGSGSRFWLDSSSFLPSGVIDNITSPVL